MSPSPDTADDLFAAGNAHLDAGRLDDALDAFSRAAEDDPARAEAHNNKGVVLRRLGRPDDAADAFRIAIELAPNHAAAHCNLGNALIDLGRPGDAVPLFEEAIRLAPDYADAIFNLGNAKRAAGDNISAAEQYRAALGVAPNHRDAANNLGLVLAEVGQADAALAAFDLVLRADPGDAGILGNKGNLLRQLGRFDDALACFGRGLEAAPGDFRLLGNRALTLQHRGALDDAIAAYGEALAAAPDDVHLRCNHAQALLLAGDFAPGWAEFEWRLREPGAAKDAHLTTPRWDGADPSGKTLLLTAEQGLGDTIQFARYARVLAARGAQAVLAVAPRMVRLCAEVSGAAEVVGEADPPPAHDAHIPLMSLPHLLETDAATIPAEVPYIAAEPERVAHWRDRLGAEEAGLGVGIAWQGNPAYEHDRARSIPLDAFAPLFDVPGTHFFVLQRDLGREALGQVAGRAAVTDLGPELDQEAAFVDTAAVLESLDLVISSDTAIPHLAGALARPVWLLLPYAPDWRWMIGRDDSPWYPTMRLFRQSAPGDWAGVVARVAAELSELAAKAGTR